MRTPLHPSDGELRAELRRLSHVLYGAIAQGGIIGPSTNQYNVHRPDSWPYSSTLVRRMVDATRKPTWALLLASMGLRSPTSGEVRRANERIFAAHPCLAMDETRLRRIARYEDGQMEGKIVGRCVWTRWGWRTRKECVR